MEQEPIPGRIDREVQDLKDHLRSWQENPPGRDQIISVMAAAILNEVEREPLSSIVRQAYKIHHILKPEKLYLPWNMASIVRTGFQKQFMLHSQYFGFPDQFTDKAHVQDSMARVLNDEMMNNVLSLDLYTREVSTNIGQRSAALKLIMLAEAERLGESPIVLDVGCSRNHILKHIGLGRPYLPVTGNSRIGGEPDIHSPDRLITSGVNRSLAQKVGLETGVGIDISPIDDHDSKAWVKACTLRPEELRDPIKVAAYDELDDENNVQNVVFVQADFTNPEMVPGADDTQTGVLVDAVFISFMLEQLGPQAQRAVLDNALRYLKPDGLIVMHGFLYPDAENELGFGTEANPYINPYTCKTLVIEKSDPTRTPRLVFEWYDGRNTDLSLPPEILEPANVVGQSVLRMLTRQAA